MRFPRLRRKIVVIIAIVAVALIGMGIWGWTAWQRARDYAKVTVSDATAWQDRKGDQTPGSAVTIALETPYHRPYADAEVVIQSWTDDSGTDLLVSELRTSYFLSGYEWRVFALTNKDSFGGDAADIVPIPNSSTPKKILWTIGSPVEAAPKATSMRVKGYVQFCEGRDRRSVRIETSDLRRGKSFRLGNTECVIDDVIKGFHDGPDVGVSIRSSDCRTPWLSVRFIDKDGSQVAPINPDRRLGYFGAQKTQERIDAPLSRSDLIASPPFSGYAAMIVEFWSEVWVKTIPFDVTVPLTWKAPVSIASLVQGPTKLIAPPSFQDRLRIEGIPDEAWGPRAGENPADLIEVMPSKSRWPRRRPERLADLDVNINKPADTASYDFTVTGFRHSEGNQLFRRGPVRSSVCQYSIMDCERYWRSIGSDEPATGQPYIPSWLEITTTPLPSSKATSVDFEGFVKLKVMDSFKTFEIENLAIDNETAYAVGAVQLSFGMSDDKERILVFSRGDFGLIRELEFLAQDGTLLHREKRSIPHLYWNNAAVADVRAFDRMKDVKRLRVRYCSEYHHYVIPFKVTVPLKKRD